MSAMCQKRTSNFAAVEEAASKLTVIRRLRNDETSPDTRRREHHAADGAGPYAIFVAGEWFMPRLVLRRLSELLMRNGSDELFHCLHSRLGLARHSAARCARLLALRSDLRCGNWHN